MPQWLRVYIQWSYSITNDNIINLRLWATEFMGIQFRVKKPINVFFLCNGLVVSACLGRCRPTMFSVTLLQTLDISVIEHGLQSKRTISNSFSFPPLFFVIIVLREFSRTNAMLHVVEGWFIQLQIPLSTARSYTSVFAWLFLPSTWVKSMQSKLQWWQAKKKWVSCNWRNCSSKWFFK